MFTMTNFAKRGRLSISWRACILLVGLCCPFPVVSSYATDSITEIQQNKTKKFRGNVLDEAGAPVTGATVQIQGKAGGVITDIDGNFTIEVGESDVLQITFIGLETQLVPVRGKASMKIVMKELRDELEEVTVVAFAKQKKESVIGSIQTVKPAELKTPSSNLTTSLAGRMAGVIAYQRSGEPGKDNANFFIRGVTTFGYKKDPLILLDNVEVSSDDLARVQPDDIASFSVLKDATSTALYGARGANGVILVTTKKGKEGRVTLNYSGSVTFETLHDVTDMMSASEWLDYARLAKYNMGAYGNRDAAFAPSYEADRLAFGGVAASWANIDQAWSNGNYDPSKVGSYNWTDHGKQTGITHEHTLSASGGSDKIQGNASFGAWTSLRTLYTKSVI